MNKITELSEDISKKLGEYIEKLRVERGLGFNQLSLKSGLNAKTLNEIINGKSKRTNPFHLKRLGLALKIDYKELYKIVGYLDEEDFEEKEITSNVMTVDDSDFIELPVRARASAGNGCLCLEECLYTVKIRKNGFSKKSYVIEVVGDSMYPVLEDGTLVIVDPTQTEYIKNKIFVVNYNDEIFIKQVEIDEDSGILMLKSINNNYGHKLIPKSESKFVKIIGRAVKVYSERNL